MTGTPVYREQPMCQECRGYKLLFQLHISQLASCSNTSELNKSGQGRRFLNRAQKVGL